MTDINRKILILICLLILFKVCSSFAEQEEKIPGQETIIPPLEITNVRVTPKVFDPTRGEDVIISYYLSRPAKSIVGIFDPQMYLVRELLGRDYQKAGKVEIIWDGRDSRNHVIPDEAYFIRIEAYDSKQGITRYDPTNSIRERMLNLEVHFDEHRNLITYDLANDARVKIQAGISKGGPLLKTIVNWKPQLAGTHRELWDGRDESGNILLVNQPGFGIFGQTLGLPETSIIARGNGRYSYFEYSKEIFPERPKKTSIDQRYTDSAQWLGLPLRMPVFGTAKPVFSLEMPRHLKRTAGGLPIVRGKVPLTIRLDKNIKRHILEQQFEIICYVDFRFVRETEEGYSPAIWMWDSAKFPSGEHILTVNVATLNGQVTSSSLKVWVEN